MSPSNSAWLGFSLYRFFFSFHCVSTQPPTSHYTCPCFSACQPPGLGLGGIWEASDLQGELGSLKRCGYQTVWFYVNLTQMRVTWKTRPQLKMPPPGRPVGKSIVHFLNQDFIWKGWDHCRQFHPWASHPRWCNSAVWASHEQQASRQHFSMLSLPVPEVYL